MVRLMSTTISDQKENKRTMRLAPVHKWLKALRKHFGYNQKDVSVWIGIARSSYTNKEIGKTPFFASELIVILDKYRTLGHKPLRQKDPEKDFDTAIKSLQMLDLLLKEHQPI